LEVARTDQEGCDFEHKEVEREVVTHRLQEVCY
jgi:hypothetical protein